MNNKSGKLPKLTAEKIIAKLRKNSKKFKIYSVKSIALFGSHLRGENKRKSDIDFLVAFEKSTFDNYMNLKIFLENLFKRKIDLLTESSLKPTLSYIKKEAQYVRA